VLSEEALIVLTAFGACGLLALGVAELLWPTRRRDFPMRSRLPTGTAPAEPPAAAPPVGAVDETEALAPAEPVRVVASISAASRPRVHRTSAEVRHGLPSGGRPYVRRTGAMAPAPASAAATADPHEVSVVERCFALHQARRHWEAIDVGLTALDDPESRPSDTHATAALWSVVALARQAMGDEVGAREALESAISVAPDADRPTYQRQLATLADGLARSLLAEVDGHASPASEECLATVRRAATWAECAAAAQPADSALAELAATTEATVWSASERTIGALVQRQEFRPARRLLREALADPRFPAERLATFRELFSATYSGEIGQLTAQALRSVQDGREIEALRALRRAETLLLTLNDEALSPQRREEVGRRLSWGYTRLGERRLDAGDHGAALEPLFLALAYEADAERRRATRVLLGRALDGVTDARTLGIRALTESGNRETALAHCEALQALVHGALTRGLTDEDIAASLAKVDVLVCTLRS
jgi:tetratricopeptide (TPR) repeat protein